VGLLGLFGTIIQEGVLKYDIWRRFGMFEKKYGIT
jgi:hypothetical protein